MELILPLKLDNLLDEPSDSRFWVRNLYPVENWDSSKQKECLKKFADSILNTHTACISAIFECFDKLFSFIYYSSELAAQTQKHLLDILVSGLKQLVEIIQNEVEDRDTLRNSLKAYLFLISGLIQKSEKLEFEKALVSIEQLQNQNLNRLFPQMKIELRFVKLITDIVLKAVSKGYTSALGDLMSWVFDMESDEIWVSWQTKALEILHEGNELSVGPLVVILESHPTLSSEFLKNLARSVLDPEKPGSGAQQTVKAIGLFIEKLSNSTPKDMINNIHITIQLLDCESYSLRNSIVVSFGEIIQYLVNADKQNATEKDTATNLREKLFDILESRVMDKSSFCRAKVLDIFEVLNRQDQLPRHRFLPIMALATSKLIDSTVYVRKKACKLLETLIYQNKLIEGGSKIEIKEIILEKLNEGKKQLEILKLALDGQIEPQFESMEPEELKQHYIKEELIVGFLTDYKVMHELLESATLTLKELLHSKNVSDIVAAIDTLVACNLRGVSNAHDAAIAMLSLIWNRDNSVRNAVSKAFSNLYLNLKLHSEEEILEKLLGLVNELTPGKLCSLEDLFSELVRNNAVSENILKKIWKIFKTESSTAAAIVLRFTTFADPSFLNSRYDGFVYKTLLYSSDWKLFRECLISFERLGNQGERTQEFLSQAMERLLEIRNSGFFSVAEQFVKTVYATSLSPMKVFEVCLAHSMKPLGEIKAGEFDLACAIYLAGSIAMKAVVHGDKLASQYKKQMLNVEVADDLDEISGGNLALVEEKMEEIKQIQEKLIYQGLFSHLTPTILSLFKEIAEGSEGNYSVLLRKAIVISIGKYMAISQYLCEENLSYFLRLGEESLDPDIRSTIVIAVGDLIMRHPNMLESHTYFLFERLKDSSSLVKKKALLVISHLVLNDMIKMKGLLGLVLEGILDKSIKRTTLVFLEELHQKDAQIIYNMIPDALSKLQETRLDHSSFIRIVDTLFKHIEKERQGENLIEKLLHRFYSCSDEECTNLGYCITLLPLGERGMRKVLDLIPAWKPRLSSNPTLLEYFNTFASKMRKNWKGDSKILCDELETGIRSNEEFTRKRKGK